MPTLSRTRLVQLRHIEEGRRVALVDASGDREQLQLLSTYRSIYSFAQAAIATGVELRELISTDLAGIALDYDPIHAGDSEWKLLASFDHPIVPTRCIVSGCANRHGMSHDSAGRADSHGQASESAGQAARRYAPTLFFKGTGATVRAHNETIRIPGYAKSGAEEAEIVGVYLIDPNRIPRRVGFSLGNEMADPALFDADANLYSHSKLRECAIGPELVLDAAFDSIGGKVSVARGNGDQWSHEIRTGEAHTEFSLAEIEQRLFQHASHRQPGDVHVHFLGGSVSSYAEIGSLTDGDQVTIEFSGMGRPLRNTIEVERGEKIHLAAPL